MTTQRDGATVLPSRHQLCWTVTATLMGRLTHLSSISPVGLMSRSLSRKLLARVVAFGGLACDAYVHFDLATSFDANIATISQGMIFRLDALLAALAALAVLLSRRWVAAFGAVLVAGGALTAVLLYTYVNLGTLGPLPNMYEPVWYPEKTLSAIAEAVTVISAGALVFVERNHV